MTPTTKGTNMPMKKIKARIKKFHQDHKREFECFIIGAGTMSAYMLYELPKHDNRLREGMRLTNAHEAHDAETNTHYLYVTHKNGETGRYPWDKPTK